MKTALCFTGTCRSLEHTFQNIKDNLIDTLGDCDVFFYIAKNPHAHKAQQYFGSLSQVKKIMIEDEPIYDIAGLRWRPNWPSGKLSSKQIYIRMIESRKGCNHMLLEYERENNISYDRVVFSRLDVKYFNEVGDTLKGLDMNFLYVPDFHNTFGGVINGYNDRFAVSNRANMGIYFEIPNSIKDFVDSGGSLHAETLLKWHLLRHKVKVENISTRFTRVRPDGREMDNRIEDQATWNVSDT